MTRALRLLPAAPEVSNALCPADAGHFSPPAKARTFPNNQCRLNPALMRWRTVIRGITLLVNNRIPTYQGAPIEAIGYGSFS